MIPFSEEELFIQTVGGSSPGAWEAPLHQVRSPENPRGPDPPGSRPLACEGGEGSSGRSPSPASVHETRSPLKGFSFGGSESQGSSLRGSRRHGVRQRFRERLGVETRRECEGENRPCEGHVLPLGSRYALRGSPVPSPGLEPLACLPQGRGCERWTSVLDTYCPGTLNLKNNKI